MEVFCFVLSGLNLTLVNNAREVSLSSCMCDGAHPSYNKIRIQFVGRRQTVSWTISQFIQRGDPRWHLKTPSLVEASAIHFPLSEFRATVPSIVQIRVRRFDRCSLGIAHYVIQAATWTFLRLRDLGRYPNDQRTNRNQKRAPKIRGSVHFCLHSN